MENLIGSEDEQKKPAAPYNRTSLLVYFRENKNDNIHKSDAQQIRISNEH